MIHRHTCLRFVPRTNERDFLTIVSEAHGCYSYVGYNNDERITNVGRGPEPTQTCVNTGTVQHELLHAAGLVHEQSRADRDLYLEVIEENIVDGQFSKKIYHLIFKEPNIIN